MWLEHTAAEGHATRAATREATKRKKASEKHAAGQNELDTDAADKRREIRVAALENARKALRKEE